MNERCLWTGSPQGNNNGNGHVYIDGVCRCGKKSAETFNPSGLQVLDRKGGRSNVTSRKGGRG